MQYPFGKSTSKEESFDKENEMDNKESKTNWLLIVGLIIVGVLCLACVGTIVFLGLQGTTFRLEYTSPQATNSTQVAPRENVCEYAGGTTDAGIQLKNESKVVGSAIVQLDKDNIVVINPGKYYTAPAGSVVWTYKGDLNCLNAQLEYFPNKTVQRIK